MSFYTSFFLYRPTKPPKVTGVDLARFVEAVGALGVLEPGYMLPTKLKFGKAIDRNDKGTTIYRPVMAGMYQVLDIEWDVKLECKSLPELCEALGRHEGTVYRAFINLGPADKELCDYVNSTAGHEETANLWLAGWSIEIEPATTQAMSAAVYPVVG